MAETALTFGPEWIRALSHGEGGGVGGGGTNQSSPPLEHFHHMDTPRYKIAEYRYGREEMLALFNRKAPLPDYMEEFTSIVTDHCQLPLALVQFTEEEQNMWARSVNSEVLQRIGPKNREGGPPPLIATGPSAAVPAGGGGPGATSILIPLRGRGGSTERGRGRGRGNYFQRGLSFEEGEGGPPPVGGFTRARGGFDRSQSMADRDQRWETETRERRFERTLTGRDENGLGRGKEGSRAPTDTWRREAGGEKTKSGVDEEGWHPVPARDKWGKSNTSWRSEPREESDRPPLRGPGGDSSEAPLRNGPSKPLPYRRPSSCWDQDDDFNRGDPAEAPTRNASNKTIPFRRPSSGWDQDHDSIRDHLPEWSVENGTDAEQVGTFDATGAFMETKNSSNGPIPKRPSVSEDKLKEAPVVHRRPRQPEAPPLISGDLHSAPATSKELSPPLLRRHDPPNNSSSIHPLEKVASGGQSSSEHSRPNSGELKQPEKHSSGATSVNEHPVISAAPTTASLSSTTAFSTKSVVAPGLASVMAPAVAPVLAACLPQIRPSEDENFAFLEKAAENMMAQWTAEKKSAYREFQSKEEQRVASQQRLLSQPQVSQTPQAQLPQKPKIPAGVEVPVVPLHHSDAYKWFYRDPQSHLQGPFTSAEMLEWFGAGYFTTGLMLRRGCDQRFAQLGELIKIFGRVPFTPGPHSLPLRALPSAIPVSLAAAAPPTVTTPSASPAVALNTDAENQMRLMLIQQQIMHQQLVYRQQIQMQSMLAQLNKQESFTSLPPQQQQQLLLQQMLAQQQMQRVPPAGLGEGLPGGMMDLPHLPLMGMGAMPNLLKSDPLALWGLNPNAVPAPSVSTAGGTPTIPSTVPWPGLGSVSGLPQASNSSATAGGSIWDLDSGSTPVDVQALARKEQEEQEAAAAAAQEALRRQEEDNRRRQLLQQQLEEEENRRRQQQEEEEIMRREMEERRRLEELKKEEEERLRREAEEEAERLRKEAEDRQRREEAEIKQAQEEELRRRKEAEKQRRKEAELMRKEEEALRKQQEEEAERLKAEMEKQRREEQERKAEQEREALRRLEQAQRALKAPTVAPWAQQASLASNNPSLSEIQRLQEERDREEKMHLLHQQQQQLQLEMQQQQQLTAKNHLTWANKTVTQTSVKTLLDIQQEEAERAAKLLKQQKQQNNLQQSSVLSGPAPIVGSSAASGWGNAASQLTWSPSNGTNTNSHAHGWALNDVSNTSGARGFWDDAASTTVKPTKTASKGGSDSAFPALDNSGQTITQTGSSNKAKNVRSKKKDEETVMKLFETHSSRQSTDEFTQWCTKALSNMQSSVDIPTFTAFLKDIESPYEVHDYVRSYLGEAKDAREFAKQFLERRSKHKNQSKQKASEENMWGPAPALGPFQNKSGLGNQQTPAPTSVSNLGADDGSKKKGKKKGKMQKLDGALLGFRVQADPDRINAGEIDHVEGNV